MVSSVFGKHLLDQWTIHATKQLQQQTTTDAMAFTTIPESHTYLDETLGRRRRHVGCLSWRIEGNMLSSVFCPANEGIDLILKGD